MGFLYKILGNKNTYNQDPKRELQTKPEYINQVSGWKVETDKNGIPVNFFKDGKEWISSDSKDIYISPSGKYFLHCYCFCGESDSEYIAITTRHEGICKKRGEIGVKSALITDAGIGYIFSDEGDLYTITAESKSKKHLCDDPEIHILIPEGCFVAFFSYGTGARECDQVVVKGILFATGKTWKKSIDFESDDYENFSMGLSGGKIAVTMPDKRIVFFDFGGTKIK